MRKIKWNWGTKLALFIIAFIIFILILVYKSFDYDVNLVEKDYYPKGLIYQQRIDAIENAKISGAEINVDQNSNEIVISIDNISADSGSILFFRPSNTSLDLELDITKIDSLISIPENMFQSGKYIVKSNWWDNNTEFYIEKVFVVK